MSVDVPPLADTVELVCSRLEAAGLEYALAGGLAVSVWSQPRATYDLDVVIAADHLEGNRLIGLAQSWGIFLLEPEKLRLPPYTSILRFHLPDEVRTQEPGMILVDFISFPADYASSILGRRCEVDFAGHRIKICSPEDLIVMKLLAGRPKDMLDCQSIIAARGPNLDKGYIERWSESFGLSKKWQSVCVGPG